MIVDNFFSKTQQNLKLLLHTQYIVRLHLQGLVDYGLDLFEKFSAPSILTQVGLAGMPSKEAEPRSIQASPKRLHSTADDWIPSRTVKRRLIRSIWVSGSR